MQLDIDKTKNSLDTLQNRLQIEEELFKFKSKSFAIGRLSWSEFNEAQDSLSALRENQIRTKTDLQVLIAKWHSARGLFAKEKIEQYLLKKGLRKP